MLNTNVVDNFFQIIQTNTVSVVKTK